jgi:hypothetical protein
MVGGATVIVDTTSTRAFGEAGTSPSGLTSEAGDTRVIP